MSSRLRCRQTIDIYYNKYVESRNGQWRAVQKKAHHVCVTITTPTTPTKRKKC